MTYLSLHCPPPLSAPWMPSLTGHNCSPSRHPITHSPAAYSPTLVRPSRQLRYSLYVAACCLAFFAFLRSGEFTCTSWASYDHSMLSLRDIAIDSHTNLTILNVICDAARLMSLGLVSQSIWGGLVTRYVWLLLFWLTSHTTPQPRVHSFCSSLEIHYLDTNLWLQSDRYCHQRGWMFLDSMATALELELQLRQPRQALLIRPSSNSDSGNPLHTHDATCTHQSTLSQPHHGDSSNLLSNHTCILLLNPVLSCHYDLFVWCVLLLLTGLADPFIEALIKIKGIVSCYH